MMDIALLLFGVALAGAGGELFVRGSVSLARAARIPAGIVGATVAAFATSSPELTVSTIAALEGSPEIGLGDAIGSNIVNVALVLGIALCMSPIVVTRDAVKRDFPVALLAPALTALLLVDGSLSRNDGLLLLSGFMLWSLVTLRAALKHRREGALPGASGWRLPVLQSVAGLALLLLAGRFFVSGAVGIAASLGIDAYVIGVTLVAVGTSAPELATTIIAKLRGHDDLSLGTILGSNIFNGLVIVSITAMIAPITVDQHAVMTTLLLGAAALVLALPGKTGFLGRGRGVPLILLYLLHIGFAFAAP